MTNPDTPDKTDTRRTVTLKVDSGELFDALAKMNGDASGIGEKLVSVMLTGQADWKDSFGLAFYGIEITDDH